MKENKTMKFIRVQIEGKAEHLINLENINYCTALHESEKDNEDLIIYFKGNPQPLVVTGNTAKSVYSALKFCSQKIS